MHKHKRLLTVLATGSAVVGGSVALNQTPAPATQLVARRASVSQKKPASADQELSSAYARVQRLTADIDAIQRQVNQLLAGGKGYPVIVTSGAPPNLQAQEAQLTAESQQLAQDRASLVAAAQQLAAREADWQRQVAGAPATATPSSPPPTTHATTGASKSSQTTQVPPTHATTGASSASGARTTTPPTHGTTGASSASGGPATTPPTHGTTGASATSRSSGDDTRSESSQTTAPPSDN